MTFVSAITSTIPDVKGTKKTTTGTFVNSAGGTGGDIDTGLKSCEKLTLQHTGSAVVASAPSVNETFPCDGSAVTIVTTADKSGVWFAEGT